MKNIIKITTFLIIVLFSFSMQVNAEVANPRCGKPADGMIVCQYDVVGQGRSIFCTFDYYSGQLLSTDVGDCPSFSENDGFNNGKVNDTPDAPGTDSKKWFEENEGEFTNDSGSTKLLPGSPKDDNGDNVITKEQDCESMLGNPSVNGSPAFYITFALKIVRYAAIIVLVVMSVLDMMSAITSHDNDEIKKATSKIIKRLIISIIIFVLPYFIELILSVAHDRSIDLCIGK